MKKLFSCFLVCTGLFSLHAEAQSSSLVVTNHTPCTINYRLGGAKAPSCESTTKGSTSIGPFATITFSDPTAVPIPTFGPTDYITYAWINSNSCIAPYVMEYVAIPCSGYGPLSNTILIFDPSTCMPCASVTAVWTVGPIQALDFY